MMWAIVSDGEVVELLPFPKDVVFNGVKHSREIFQKWSTDQLLEIGIYPVQTENFEDNKQFYTQQSVSYTVKEDVVIRTITYIQLPLEEIRDIVKQKINRWKESKQNSDFLYNDSPFQCDISSRIIITGAALDALISKTMDNDFTINFLDSNNTIHTLDADGMIALGKAAKNHVEYWHTQALIKKMALEQAETLEQILEIDSTLDTLNG